jgi:L-phenylalanine/L-methionine N-acetyltransferase
MSETVIIRSFEPSDAHAISQLFGSDGVFEGTLQLPSMPIASRIELFTRLDLNSCGLVAIADGALVGYGSLFSLSSSPRVKHRRGVALAIAKSWQGKGVGGQLLKGLLDWADNWAGVLRVELTVYTDNAAAIWLYEKHGFVREGLHRAYALRGGHYVDAYAMARLHPQQPLLPNL